MAYLLRQSGCITLYPTTATHPIENSNPFGSGTVIVILAGTACTVQGCFNAGTDPDTQANLKQEISDINQTVKKLPVFPIVSLGFAVRF